MNPQWRGGWKELQLCQLMSSFSRCELAEKGGSGKADAGVRPLELQPTEGDRREEPRQDGGNSEGRLDPLERTGASGGLSQGMAYLSGPPLILGPSQVEMEGDRNPGVRSTRVVASSSAVERGERGQGGERGVLREDMSAAGGVVASAAADGSLAAYGGGASAAAGGSSAAYGGPSATAAVLGSSSALPHEVQRPPGLPQGDDRGIPQGGSTMIHDGGPRGGVILPEGPTMTQDGIARPEVCLTPRRAQQVNPFRSPERRAEALRVHGGVDPVPAVADGALLPGGPGSGRKSEQGGRSSSYVEMDPVELFRLRCLREAEEKFTRGMARMNAGEDGSASGSYHTATASGGILGDMGVHGQGRLPALQHQHPSTDQRLQMGFGAGLDQRPLQVPQDSGALGALDGVSPDGGFVSTAFGAPPVRGALSKGGGGSVTLGAQSRVQPEGRISGAGVGPQIVQQAARGGVGSVGAGRDGREVMMPQQSTSGGVGTVGAGRDGQNVVNAQQAAPTLLGGGVRGGVSGGSGMNAQIGVNGGPNVAVAQHLGGVQGGQNSA